jgi:hypothetical protein
MVKTTYYPKGSMTFYLLTEKTGPRKRDEIGYFASAAVAEEIRSTFDTEADAQVAEINVFDGTAEAWLANRDTAARTAILSKLTDAERRVLGL